MVVWSMDTELQILWGFKDNAVIILSFLSINIHCDPSLEPSRRDSSYDRSQCMFSLRNKENYPYIISNTPLYPEGCYNRIFFNITAKGMRM